MDLCKGYWIHVLGFILSVFPDLVGGLKCWHCIADNCDMSPSDNYKASKRECQPHQCCQKVVFKMHSLIDDIDYISTVRSCAGECDSHDDFENCTTELYTTRGCVTKSSCVDQDLCNTANTLHTWITTCLLLALVLNISFFLSLR